MIQMTASNWKMLKFRASPVFAVVLLLIVACSSTLTPTRTQPTVAGQATESPSAAAQLTMPITNTTAPTKTPEPPTVTPQPSTPTPKPIIATAKSNVNVRVGPGTNYSIIGTLKAGEQLPLIGKTVDSTWWQINFKDGNGWILAPLAQVNGNTDNVAVVSVAPSPTLTSRAVTPTTGRVVAQVSRVIDGDTIAVLISGKTYTIRYIGVDTPETVAPGQPVEWMGQEASTTNKSLVAGKNVYLEKDVSETDKYGRLLRYVFVGELFVNAELVRRGYAKVSTYPPDVKYQALFLQMQQEARAAGRGLWGATPIPISQPTAAPSRSGNCDPSYPDVCIPLFPPDLDCKDVPYKRFRVLPPDPHRFDGDNDGIGCEK